MRKDIRVSFKDDTDEDKLHDDIIAECKYIGKSSWMKLAAREKIERDHGGSKPDNKPQKIMMNNNQSGVINSLDDLFQK